MSPRDLLAAALVALALTATLPGYQRVFTSGAWRGPALGAALLALGIVLLVRLARRGLLLGLAVSLVALFACLPWLLGISERPVLPTADLLRQLSDLLAQGLDELAVTPAPTEPLPGLMLLVVGGFWVVAHVAGEAVIRVGRPGAGLVSLAVLWVSPLVVPLDLPRSWTTTVPFLATAALLLLLVEPTTPGEPDDEPAWSTTGAALAAVAIGVAVIAPGLLPGYGAPAWVDLGSSAAPRGYQPIVDISTRLRLPEERDILRVHASQRTYLRLAGLDTFDGATWRLGPDDQGSYQPDPSNLYAATDVLPPEEPAARTELVSVEVEVLALENIYVPVPYQPIEVLGPQRGEMVWSTEGGFLATVDTVDDELTGSPRAGLREGASYRVQAARPVPGFDDLLDTTWDEAALQRHTRLPRDYGELGALAQEIYDRADATTTVERALALQEWFTGPAGGFTYDLDVPALRGDDALRDFVLEDRVGYCEYFATAMAVMLRQTGIPARVAVGFLPGRVSRAASPAQGRPLTEFTVSTADAHAWVEVLFPGSGWVTFEPTPRSDDTQIVPTADDLAPIENLRERRARELRELAEQGLDGPVVPDESIVDPFEEEAVPGTGGVDRGPDADGATTSGRGGGWATAAGMLAVALAVTAVVAVRRRRTPGARMGMHARDRILAAQRQVLAVAGAHGVGRRTEETLREVVDRWVREGRIARPDPRVLGAIEAAAFGGRGTATEADEVASWARETITALRTSVSSRDRVLSPVRAPTATAGRAVRRGASAVRERIDRSTTPSA